MLILNINAGNNWEKLWEIYLSLVVGRGNICSPLLHNSQHMEQPQRKLRLKPNIKKAIAHLGTRTCSFCVCLVTCLCYSWASDVQCMCQTDAKCVHERGRNQITPFWIQVMFSVFRGPKYDDMRRCQIEVQVEYGRMPKPKVIF